MTPDQYRSCEACGATSVDRPIFLVGPRWLCGACGLPVGAVAMEPWDRPVSGEVEG